MIYVYLCRVYDERYPSNFEAWPVHMVPAKLGCGNLKMWTGAHQHPDDGWESPSIEERSDGSQTIASQDLPHNISPPLVGGGFKDVLFSPLFGEMIQFD